MSFNPNKTSIIYNPANLEEVCAAAICKMFEFPCYAASDDNELEAQSFWCNTHEYSNVVMIGSYWCNWLIANSKKYPHVHFTVFSYEDPPMGIETSMVEVNTAFATPVHFVESVVLADIKTPLKKMFDNIWGLNGMYAEVLQWSCDKFKEKNHNRLKKVISGVKSDVNNPFFAGLNQIDSDPITAYIKIFTMEKDWSNNSVNN